MKHIKKSVAFFVAVLLLSGLFAGTVTANEEAITDKQLADLIPELPPEFWGNYAHAGTYHNLLLSLFPTTRSGEIIYPDFFGGVYYTEEGHLVVQIVDDVTVTPSVEDFLAQADGIIIEYVDFSYNEIKTTLEILDALFLAEDSPDALENVRSYGVDALNNRVRIDLIVYNNEEITRFRETVLDSPLIVFEESQQEPFVDFGGNNTPDTLIPSQQNNTFLFLLGIFGIGLLGMGTFLWVRQKRLTFIKQMANGGVVSSGAPVSRKQVIAAEKTSGSEPRDDLFVGIVEKIAESSESNK